MTLHIFSVETEKWKRSFFFFLLEKWSIVSGSGSYYAPIREDVVGAQHQETNIGNMYSVHSDAHSGKGIRINPPVISRQRSAIHRFNSSTSRM